VPGSTVVPRSTYCRALETQALPFFLNKHRRFEISRWYNIATWNASVDSQSGVIGLWNLWNFLRICASHAMYMNVYISMSEMTCQTCPNISCLVTLQTEREIESSWNLRHSWNWALEPWSCFVGALQRTKLEERSFSQKNVPTCSKCMSFRLSVACSNMSQLQYTLVSGGWYWQVLAPLPKGSQCTCRLLGSRGSGLWHQSSSITLMWRFFTSSAALSHRFWAKSSMAKTHYEFSSKKY
jgi:hypothetical protein